MANKQFHVRHGLQVSGSGLITGNLQVTQGVSSSQRIKGAPLESESDLQVAQNASVGGTLSVTGNTALYGSLQVSGAASVGSLQVLGNAQVTGNLTVSGPTATVVTLDATNVQASNLLSGAQIRGTSLSITTVDAGGAIQSAGTISGNALHSATTLQVSGTASIGGQMLATGNVYAGQQLRAGGSVSVAGSVIAKQNLHVSGTASIGGDTIIDTNLQVSGLASVGGGFKVGGTACLQSHVDINGNLTVSGESDFQSKLSANTISASGQVIVDQQVQADGSILAGATVRGNTICAQASLFVNQNLRVTGTTQLKGGVSVTQTTTIAGTAFTGGWVRIGSATAGVAIDPNEIYFSGTGNLGTLSGNLVLNPAGQITAASKTLTLGTLDANAMQVSGHTSMGSLRVVGTFSVGGEANLNGILQVSGQASIGGQLFVAQQIRATGGCSVEGGLHSGGGLQVSGTASIGNVRVIGTLSVGGESNFGAKISANTISASGQVIVDQQVQADGSGLFGQTVRAGGNLCGQGSCIINGATTMRQSLDVSGSIQCSAVLSGTQIRGTSLSITTIDAGGAIQSAGTISGNAFHTPGTLQVSGAASVGSLKVTGGLCAQGQLFVNQNFRVTGTADINSSLQVNGTVSATSVYSTGQVRAVGALSCAATGHFGQGIQVSGTVSCTALHATGGSIQTTGAISGNPLRSGGQLCAALQIFANQTVVARKNLHVSGTACVGGSSKFVGAMAVCGKLTGTQISCHRILSQSGNVNSGGADFAEYFEWADGNPNVSDRIGRSVAITGPSGKIGIATAGQTPFGVITGRPGFIGAAAHGEWAHKWSRDDYFRIQRDENGEKILNPEWNSACTYINRESRKEWAKVGLLGKLAVRVGETINPNWTKMRVVTATIEEYLVR